METKGVKQLVEPGHGPVGNTIWPVAGSSVVQFIEVANWVIPETFMPEITGGVVSPVE